MYVCVGGGYFMLLYYHLKYCMIIYIILYRIYMHNIYTQTHTHRNGRIHCYPGDKDTQIYFPGIVIVKKPNL